jgi:N-acetylglucosamine-6-phosphate deacetylase
VKGHKAIMVSDSVSLAGMPPGNYSTPVGGRVVLTPEGKLHLANNPGTLAGSAQALIQGVSNLYGKGLCGLADAWELASINPAKLMGLAQQQGLQPGAPADMVLFYDDKHVLYVSATYKNGINVYNLH